MVILKYRAWHRFLQLEDLNSEKYNTNLRTFMSNYDEIKNQHRGEFIAIFDGDIVADTSREALLERIREKVEDKDIDSVFQTYISKTDDIIWWFSILLCWCHVELELESYSIGDGMVDIVLIRRFNW